MGAVVSGDAPVVGIKYRGKRTLEYMLQGMSFVRYDAHFTDANFPTEMPEGDVVFRARTVRLASCVTRDALAARMRGYELRMASAAELTAYIAAQHERFTVGSKVIGPGSVYEGMVPQFRREDECWFVDLLPISHVSGIAYFLGIVEE